MVRLVLLLLVKTLSQIVWLSLLVVLLVMMSGFLILHIPFHICTNRDLFGSYEPLQNGDFVRMRDDNPCEIVGIG